MPDNNSLKTNIPQSQQTCVSPELCNQLLDAKCIIYTGQGLSHIGVSTNDRLDVILNKINNALSSVVMQERLGIFDLTGGKINFVNSNGTNIQQGGNYFYDCSNLGSNTLASMTTESSYYCTIVLDIKNINVLGITWSQDNAGANILSYTSSMLGQNILAFIIEVPAADITAIQTAAVNTYITNNPPEEPGFYINNLYGASLTLSFYANANPSTILGSQTIANGSAIIITTDSFPIGADTMKFTGANGNANVITANELVRGTLTPGSYLNQDMTDGVPFPKGAIEVIANGNIILIYITSAQVSAEFGIYVATNNGANVAQYDSTATDIINQQNLAYGTFFSCAGLAPGDVQDNYFTALADGWYGIIKFNAITGQIVSITNTSVANGGTLYDYYASDFAANISVMIIDGTAVLPTPYKIRFINLSGKSYTFHMQAADSNSALHDMAGSPYTVAPGAAIEIDATNFMTNVNTPSYNLTWQFIPTAGESTYTSKSNIYTDSSDFGTMAEIQSENGGDEIGYAIQSNRTIIITGD